ncbi:MAG TPA: hypothetical protein VFD36_25800 [Kofleriaceae bacterium]|nr:hypothetical protein [Kofleriaceae bacterium]
MSDRFDERAEGAVDAIIYDLDDRRGLKREWRGIDADIQQEIKREWSAIVARAIREAVEAEREAIEADVGEVKGVCAGCLYLVEKRIRARKDPR